jgi:hypothetical protein
LVAEEKVHYDEDRIYDGEDKIRHYKAKESKSQSSNFKINLTSDIEAFTGWLICNLVGLLFF